MNQGGDAAEEVVRMSLEGVEVAAKISGQGAKLIAVNLVAALKSEQKTRGKARLSSMLKSGKPLKVYEIQQKDLKRFAQEAKRYGVLYCVLKDKTGQSQTVDVISRVEDASKIQRITERFRFVAVNKADVKSDVTRDKALSNPSSAQTAKDGLSAPSSKEASRTNTKGSHKWESRSDEDSKEERPSVREKLAEYRKERETIKREPVKKKQKVR